MELYGIKINDKDFKVAIADNPELRQKGLSGIGRLGPTKGMLFIFPEEVQLRMVMRDMSFDLDFIFVNKNWEVTQLGSLSIDDTEGIVSEEPCFMVLEVPAGAISSTGISVGDVLEPGKEIKTQFKGVSKFKHGGTFEMIGDKVFEVLVDDIEVDSSKMQILNDKGEVVSNIGSGSRVFSRPHTKQMIAKHKKGNKIDLADTFIAIIDIQDKQKQEFVTK